MDDQSEFISLQLNGNTFKFQGISDTGIIAEEQTHETETCQSSLKFSGLFYKKYLKVVTSSVSLHKTVHLSFFPDEESETYPVLFSYELDQSLPKSHFSIYILPIVNS